MKEVILNAEAWVKQLFSEDSTGHDWYHTDRVRHLAKVIAEKEGADSQFCELAALLHDAGDDKFHSDEESGRLFVEQWLKGQNVQKTDREEIMGVIDTVSFKGGNNKAPETLEGEVVQDADRLDALGAIGIARCFMFAGNRGDAMHIPGERARDQMTKEEYRDERSTAVNHFYEKLLKLSSQMKTDTGKELAKARHLYMEDFLNQFYSEWEGKK
ncbi:HD domain-containing protein [Salipaludibacillus sp. CUR1]|uniref:HD domain-containing protein n=1 Tax=Salipaludibacillus sp. CUR1 TaxID=2820003 RepID=UPI001E407B25|nr:HD domain-containing protein [Salipaludibacillus sp. CUR1]MCE7792364.1 HD domain-containing protein [Salipaludibacillus sp. CUR1]